MNALVSTLVALAVLLEVVGLVGLVLVQWPVGSALVLWLAAFGLLVVARGCERLETETPNVGYEAGVSR
ncbi:hypothetical protein [Halomarina oriensis]|uniref:Uncharacterized protein n=1 Tax=Halomarina oriensis TaxID=671145 RepID=A0A6B0GMW4_9EURY|nr:hypothetical protein [Halomarina oriensis]MWG36114.1 hypothetical protein [Halomarina oriensis]